ncbi:hypothetical protein PHMEG_0009380 [Phytophthora megakarya]|uniref:Uncharacterized protein n=1 Tax=Phytophthora megakarya TaxID=4795 RepID=A0A225WH94_9STRA|nr:hypothetical protein PHMEG_0009380 [Phytophthora megakarya]
MIMNDSLEDRTYNVFVGRRPEQNEVWAPVPIH